MSRFINVESNNNLICMPLRGSKKFLKIQFKSSGIHGKDSKKENTSSRDSEHARSLRNPFRRFEGPERTGESLDLPRNLSKSISQKAKVVGGLPVKSRFKHISGEPSKSKFSIGRLNSDSSFLKRNVRNPRILTANLIQQEHAATQFLSVLKYTGRMVRNKTGNRLLRTRSLQRASTIGRLSEFRKLQLFHALLKEPLPILDVRTRFGISKQTLKRLCKRGLLAEVWGPGPVGLRFKLTKKGKTELDELEAAAKYDSHMSKKDIIRLKSKA